MKKLLSVFLVMCLLLTAFPLTAFAAQDNASPAGDNSGATGDCTWNFDSEYGELTISGSGAMANYYDSTMTPWFGQAGHIKTIQIQEGVTHIGDSAFAFIGGLQYINLPDSLKTIGSNAFKSTSLNGVFIPEGVTSIGANAFRDCTSLGFATLPKSLETVGQAAFLNTALSGIELPNFNTQIGYYAFGYDSNAKKMEGFTVTGYDRSTACGYANSNGFTFIDIEGTQYALRVYMGRAIKVTTQEVVTKARAGERIQIDQHPDPYVTIKGYSAEGVTFEQIDGKWYFTMPDHALIVYLNYETAKPINIDFSHGDTVSLSTEQYLFLTVNSNILTPYRTSSDGSGTYTYDLDSNGADDVRIERYQAVKLGTASIQTSVSFSKDGASFSPVTFLFAANSIDSVELYLEFPNAGDSYDYAADGAALSTMGDNRFTIESATWYSEWGIAPERFEGGQKYFVEMVLRPAEGYAFFANTRVKVNASEEMPPYATVYRMDNSGSLHAYTTATYLPGEAHAVHVNGGMAAKYPDQYNAWNAVSGARAGEAVWLSVSTESVPEGCYAVSNTLRYSSDNAIIEGEAQQFFIMPDEDVDVTISYSLQKQFDGVMDLRGGKPFLADDGGDNDSSTQAYGMRVLLYHLSKDKDVEWDSEHNREIIRYDIDGDGSFDVCSVNNEYTLLETNSLNDPTGQITLTFKREDCLMFPMRSLTILFAEPTVKKHRVIVENGIASAASGDHNGEHRIFEAYPGEHVYLFPDASRWNNEYAVQFTIDATSDDVSVNTEGDMFFIMPDKDVTVTVTYQTAPLLEGVMDLREGAYIADKGERYAMSEDYGMYFILQKFSAREESDFDSETYNMTFKFDIDNYGGYDIGYDQGARTFSLLPENSLRPASGRVTLSLPESGYYTVPMHRLTILLAGEDEQLQKHKITVNGGFASSENFSYDYPITSQYPYETVYLMADPSAVPEGKYVTGVKAESPDAEIADDMGHYFVMPEHDVTVNMTYELADRIPFVLDFSKSDAVQFDTAAEMDDVADSLAACAAVRSWYDSETESYVYQYDLNSDGKYDIASYPEQKTIRLLHHDFNGVQTLTGEKTGTFVLKYYPITVIFSAALKGDVDGDSRVTIADATALQRFLAEFDDAWLDLSVPQVLYAADADGDGRVTVRDVTAIQRIVAEL